MVSRLLFRVCTDCGAVSVSDLSQGGGCMSKSQATKLVELIDETALFHFGEECYATLSVNGHQENWPLRAKGFRRWLSHQFFELEGKTPNGSAMQSAIETLAGKAQFRGVERQLFVRLAEHNGAWVLSPAPLTFTSHFHFSRSTIIAIPWPTPMHMVASP